MTPGPTQILKISPTGTLVKIATIASGNTFGARFWTDGKQEAPMLPDQPWLRRHPETDELFWSDECEEIAEETPWGEDESYPKVPFAEEPTLDDYRRALVSGIVTTPEQMRYVFMRYWWAVNDPLRHGDASTTPPSENNSFSSVRCSIPPTPINVSWQRRSLGNSATLPRRQTY